MAAFALAAVGALLELAAVNVCVTIGALLECNRLLEVRRLVAIDAGYFSVLAQQWEFGFGVIEARERLLGALPRRGGVAAFAPLLKRALVGIGVAVGT